MRENAWKKYDEAGLKEVFEYCEGYISDCKTERECVSESIRIAETYGYRNLEDIIKNKETLKSGDKVYANNMGKGIALFLIGEEPMAAGCNILGAHVDSPHGVVVKKDKTVIELNIGEDDSDPIVGISDLLVHLSADQMSKKASNVIEGEDLNVTIGSMPLDGEEKDAVKANILKLLKEKYDFEEDDFVSAEIEVVPAGKARDYGLDRSMVAGYGHDDRICAYTSMMAQLETESVKRTAVTLLVDKEEVGSIGATGQHSRFFENTVAEVMDRLGEYSELNVRRALKNSKMLSSDVSAAFDPNYAAVNEEKNSAFMGHGLVFNKYTGSRGKGGCNDANAEYMAELRNIMDSENVTFQTAELGKVDQGGGGTIAYILAQYNMEVIDSGIALHNMHAPWEIASKIDIWEATKGYKAFLKHA